MGVPFVAVRGLLGSDMLTYRPDLLVQDNPFKPGEQVVVAQPIRPDVAVFHALQADRWGNAITPGPRDDVMLARAARRVADSRPKWLLFWSMRNGSEFAPSTSALMTGSQPSSRYFFISLTRSP